MKFFRLRKLTHEGDHGAIAGMVNGAIKYEVVGRDI
jgi:hypothetical protein